MKRTMSLLCAATLALCACTGCTKEEESSSAEPQIVEISIPENILGDVQISVPDFTVDKYSLPENEAMQFVEDMKIGWNLGNTFDASNCNVTDELQYEQAWCGYTTTTDTIAAVKAAGFETIRIPVSWHNHVDENNKISEAWMNRVKEVVGWALSCDLKVIVNTHHDIDSKYYPDSEHLESSKAYLSSVWSQIAEAFKDYDNNLILEGMNEPRLKGTDYEWWYDQNNAQCKDSMQCINALNQLFVDTVRASGGNNANRFLMVCGYCASVDGTCNDDFQLPTDTVANRLIVSIHAYTPYNFALNKTGTKDFSVENELNRKEIVDFMDKLYAKFTANGVPVFIGEFGAMNKDNEQARVEFAAFYTATARARGISCCWWDNNAFSGSGENFGLLFRSASIYNFPAIVKALVQYSAAQ